MVSALRVGIALVLIGVALVTIPIHVISTPSATYYIDATVVEEHGADARVVLLEDVDADHRSNVSRAIRFTGDVSVGTSQPDLPDYVRYDGQVYRVVVIVGDPGEGILVTLSLGLLASGVTAVGAGALALGLAGWRRVG